MGTLYIVSTPIGNLEDITLRAIKILKKINIIACEDTRRTGLLLQKLEVINKKLLSYYEQNELQRIPEIINLLENGNDIALVSDSGVPTISDPGFKLVREAISKGIKVEGIPGASSVLAALTVSGLPTDKFLFIGFPPKKEGHRKKLFGDLTKLSLKTTVIMFEAPHRLVKTFEELKEILTDIDIVICRELTKLHEEVRREKISEALIHFKKVNPKGEFVILWHR